jgi:hypothetical protein
MMKAAAFLPVLGALGLTACQTSPHPPTGYLASYEGIAPPGRSLRAAVNQRRDEAAALEVRRVYIAPAVLTDPDDDRLSDEDRAILLREVDRRLCFAVSRWFTVIAAPEAEAGTIRTAVVDIRPTGRLGSAASAALGFVNPIPLTEIRVPLTTGGLAVESELIGPNGEQLAAVTWARNANIVGRDDPSLSRVGDALQMTEPMGKAVGRAFAGEREVREVADPDPCSQFGPRRNATRWVAAQILDQASGLYVPQVSGLAAPAIAATGEAEASAPRR